MLGFGIDAVNKNIQAKPCPKPKLTAGLRARRRRRWPAGGAQILVNCSTLLLLQTLYHVTKFSTEWPAGGAGSQSTRH